MLLVVRYAIVSPKNSKMKSRFCHFELATIQITLTLHLAVNIYIYDQPFVSCFQFSIFIRLPIVTLRFPERRNQRRANSTWYTTAVWKHFDFIRKFLEIKVFQWHCWALDVTDCSTIRIYLNPAFFRLCSERRESTVEYSRIRLMHGIIQVNLARQLSWAQKLWLIRARS